MHVKKVDKQVLLPKCYVSVTHCNTYKTSSVTNCNTWSVISCYKVKHLTTSGAQNGTLAVLTLKHFNHAENLFLKPFNKHDVHSNEQEFSADCFM